MKNIFKSLLAVTLLLAAAPVFAEDKYDLLAKEISEAGAKLSNNKIAILPFSYADGRTGAKDGAIISEKITMRMIKQQKFEVIERSVLDKVMGELKLQASGVMDAQSTKELGKVLGVEAIVTGTLVEMQAGQIEVNARLIKTETAQAIGASQVVINKDWMGGDAATAPAQPVQPAYQPAPQPEYQAAQPAYQAPAPVVSQPRQRGQYEYGYFDIFYSGSSPEMSMEFYNPNNNIRLSHLGGIVGFSDGPYRTVNMDEIPTEGFALAMRVGGYGNRNVGGAFEFGLDRRTIPQGEDIKLKLNGSEAGTMHWNVPDYLQLTSFYMVGNLMVRFTKKTPVEPYIGMGLGLSLNAVNLPYVKGYTNTSTFNTPTDDFAVGLVFNLPVGVRIRAGQNFQLLAEFRYQLNTMTYDRGVTSERDVITVKGGYFNVGMGFTF